MTSRAVIFGCAGVEIGDDERKFFAETEPTGFILFARNCQTPDQVLRLTAALRDSISWNDAPVLIDQEGGRVARLGPPNWARRPPARVFADLARRGDMGAAREAARINARLIAADLRAIGITVDCAPVLDVPVPGAHEIIGDRAHGEDPETIATLGRAVCEGLLAGGVLPVIKHIPGHGRATADSHVELPVVEATREEMARTDFAPFAALRDMACAMAAHVLYTEFDATAPATASPRVIEDVIRRDIGFDGLLFSDDIGMAALSGTTGERCAAMLAAGCDVVLECSGDIEVMLATADAASPLTDAASARLERALGEIGPPDEIDVAQSTARLTALIDATTV
jgi:beta-N-acetylhexosaminidase